MPRSVRSLRRLRVGVVDALVHAQHIVTSVKRCREISQIVQIQLTEMVNGRSDVEILHGCIAWYIAEDTELVLPYQSKLCKRKPCGTRFIFAWQYDEVLVRKLTSLA